MSRAYPDLHTPQLLVWGSGGRRILEKLTVLDNVPEHAVIDQIDDILRQALQTDKLALLHRWKTEYEKSCLPFGGRIFPAGFEANLVALLFSLLLNKCPHLEWPYKSRGRDLQGVADLHVIETFGEIWFEIGMYASNEEWKYSKDFEKLCNLIDHDSRSVGVLVHFEIYPRNQVLSLFQGFKKWHDARYDIDVAVIGSKETIHLLRLLIQRKRGGPNDRTT